MSAEIFLKGRVQLCCGDSIHFLRDERARESIKARMAGQPIDHGPLFAEANQ